MVTRRNCKHRAIMLYQQNVSPLLAAANRSHLATITP